VLCRMQDRKFAEILVQGYDQSIFRNRDPQDFGIRQRTRLIARPSDIVPSRLQSRGSAAPYAGVDQDFHVAVGTRSMRSRATSRRA
jgi:hypothetical protein